MRSLRPSDDMGSQAKDHANAKECNQDSREAVIPKI